MVRPCGRLAAESVTPCPPPPQALSANHTSLLGDPPKELKIPTNPYLNLASVLPGIILQGTLPPKGPNNMHLHILHSYCTIRIHEGSLFKDLQ